MATNAAWSSRQMWRVAGALKALRREIEKSKAAVERSSLARFRRQARTIELQRRKLVAEAERINNGTDEERDAFTQRIIQFYRDLGELEHFAESLVPFARENDDGPDQRRA